MSSASWADFGSLNSRGRAVWVVKLLAMFVQQMVVEMYCVHQTIAIRALHLATALHHLLVDPQLSVLHLLHLSHLPKALIAGS